MMNGHILPFLGDAKKTEMLDSASGQAVQVVENLDIQESNASALNAEIQSVRKMALMLVLVLVDSIIENDLGEDELPSDRLDALLSGFASDAEDAFASLGVSDELIATIFSEESEADEAIESACELVESTLPTGDDLQEFVDLFVYGEAQDDGDTMLDGVSLGKTTTKSGKFGKVVYKAVKAIRNGKVAIVNKRVSGRVKLSAKQRSALKKARVKASSSGAIKRRVRSMKKAKALNV